MFFFVFSYLRILVAFRGCFPFVFFLFLLRGFFFSSSLIFDLLRNLAKEEYEPIRDQDEIKEIEDVFRLCLVGKALKNSIVHFPSLRIVLAELWHPIEGVTILELDDKRILFQFYNEVDLRRLIEGMPSSLIDI